MKRLYCTLSSLALAFGSPAMADTVATELWAEWQAQAAAGGQTISADVTETDTGLTLSNFVTLMEEEDFSTRGEIDQIELIENADGTVSVTYADVYAMTFTFEPSPGEPPANIEMLLRHDNLQMQVSGDAGARVYSYTADAITITEGAITGGGSEPPDIDIEMAMTDIATTYSLTGTDPADMRFTSEGSLGGLTLVVQAAPPPPEQGSFKAAFVFGPMQATSEGSLVSLTSMEQFDTALPEGFELSGTTTYEDMALEIAFDSPFDAFTALYSNEGGTIGASIAPEAISYDIAATGASASVTGTDIPVPVEISVGSSELVLDMPLAASEEVQDMGLRLGVQDLMIGESLLAMVDPGQAVPRDPASLLIDVTGQVQLFMDLMNLNPDDITTAPGELRAIALNELRLSVGGAELTGTADLTFAPGQIIPSPVGTAELELAGGNALLDALIAGGMVPADQALFIRGATSMFARPGATPDTLETTVEFGEGGSITANGIPLQ